MGEDALFVWRALPQAISVLADSTFLVAIIHAGNTSPKQTDGAYWRPWPIDELRRLIAADWTFYETDFQAAAA